MNDNINLCMDNLMEFGDITLKLAMDMQKRCIIELAEEPDPEIRKEKAEVMLSTQDAFVNAFVTHAVNELHYKIGEVFKDGNPQKP